ncbi:MAG: hypothetical protein IPK73_05390 [Candidatus Obscuribacter sp.]|nr:hypothetical protein [Candidatus Obscuribacter sp.]MBK9279031.1 hypothetical protein [Candidatus Obscuribacter sp.]
MYTYNPVVFWGLLVLVFLTWMICRKYFPFKINRTASRGNPVESQRQELSRVVAEMISEMKKASAAMGGAAQSYNGVVSAEAAVAEQIALFLSASAVGGIQEQERKLAVAASIAQTQAELRVKCAACREAIGTSVQSSASLERALLALKNAVALEARQIELLSELLATAQALLHVIEICHTCIRPAGLAASLIAVEAERAVVPVVPDKGLIADQLRAKPEETVQRRFSYGARPPLP